jgi:hypothetical protein
MRSSRTTLAGILLAGAMLGPTAARAVTIDAFTDPFPPHPSLPVLAAPWLFVGTLCDGAACPPANLVSQALDTADQSGLGGVIGGKRAAQLQLYQDLAVARIDPVARRLYVHHAPDGRSTFELQYGKTTYLNLDLVAAGATMIRFDLTNSSPLERRVEVGLMIATRRGEPGEAVDTRWIPVTADGPVTFPLADFSPSLDWTDVDTIALAVSCYLIMGQDWSVGPLATESGPTPTGRTSWGRMKSLYR